MPLVLSLSASIHKSYIRFILIHQILDYLQGRKQLYMQTYLEVIWVSSNVKDNIIFSEGEQSALLHIDS